MADGDEVDQELRRAALEQLGEHHLHLAGRPRVEVSLRGDDRDPLHLAEREGDRVGLVEQLERVHARPNGVIELVEVERLEYVVDGPHLERRLRQRKLLRGSDRDDGHLRVVSADALQRLETVRAGKPEIEEHDVRVVLTQRGKSILRVAGLAHAVPLLREVVGQERADPRLVIDDQNLPPASQALPQPPPCTRRARRDRRVGHPTRVAPGRDAFGIRARHFGRSRHRLGSPLGAIGTANRSRCKQGASLYPLGLPHDARHRQHLETQIEVRWCHADIRCCRGTGPIDPEPGPRRGSASRPTSLLAHRRGSRPASGLPPTAEEPQRGVMDR